jgi:hypothetical protein
MTDPSMRKPSMDFLLEGMVMSLEISCTLQVCGTVWLSLFHGYNLYPSSNESFHAQLSLSRMAIAIYGDAKVEILDPSHPDVSMLLTTYHVLAVTAAV